MPGVGDLHRLLPDGLLDGLGHNAMLLIVSHLHSPALLRLLHRRPYGAGDAVGIEDHPGAGIAGGTAYGLDQALLIPQKALFVCIQDAYESHLGDIQPLSQKVDSHQYIESTQAEFPDDLSSLQGIDIRV